MGKGEVSEGKGGLEEMVGRWGDEGRRGNVRRGGGGGRGTTQRGAGWEGADTQRGVGMKMRF